MGILSKLFNVGKAESGRSDLTICAKKEYDDLLTRLQSWCQTEAEQHIQEASWYEQTCLYLEVATAVMGSVSVGSAGHIVLNLVSKNLTIFKDLRLMRFLRIGVYGSAAGFGVGFLDFLGKGSASLLPTIQQRADDHTQVTFDWNTLRYKVIVTRIDLRRPDMSIDDLNIRYTNHLYEYCKLSKIILVSPEVRKKYASSKEPAKAYKEALSFKYRWPIEQFSPECPNSSGKFDSEEETPLEQDPVSLEEQDQISG